MSDLILGIDASSTKVAVVALPLSSGKLYGIYEATKLAKKAGPQACYEAHKAMTQFLDAWDGFQLHAWMEAPVVAKGGAWSTIAQAMTSGAIQVAMYEHGLRTIEYVRPPAWKKEVVGHGHATKEDVATFLERTRPDLFAATGGSQDLIDAACIALYGFASFVDA